MKSPTSHPSLEERILSMLEMSPSKVFHYGDFAGMSTPGACRIALKRLCDAGRVQRLFCGLYRLAGPSLPPPEAIAAALARKFGWLIRPETDDDKKAATAQRYLSSGPYRVYDIAGFRLEFRHAAQKRLAAPQTAVRARLHALSERVKAHLPEGVLEKLHHVLPVSYRSRLKDEVEQLVSLGLMLVAENEKSPDAPEGESR